ncbi:GNAT family N-acetyltransferase [Zooshikella sp. RANM57]|uniref:GNAT family N-acetyltransferase n=1 Tax=Zooshikella sp. RANM57 TaxID=3425863 RepID=UPI003D6FB036
MKISNLQAFPECIPEIAQWHYAEWHTLYPQKTLSDFETDLYTSLNKHTIPQTWVLHDDEEIIGTASLLKHDMKTNTDLSPWLADIFIRVDKRNMGFGKLLVKRIINEVGKLNVPHFYLFTEDQHVFYEKLGWSLLKKELYEDQQVSIMKYTFNEKANVKK